MSLTHRLPPADESSTTAKKAPSLAKRAPAIAKKAPSLAKKASAAATAPAAPAPSSLGLVPCFARVEELCAIGADPADVLDNAPALFASSSTALFASWDDYVAGKKDLIDEVRAAAGGDYPTFERGGGGRRCHGRSCDDSAITQP